MITITGQTNDLRTSRKEAGMQLLFARSVLLALVVMAAGVRSTDAKDNMAVWQEFVASLKDSTMTVERIRPYPGLSAETLLGWLKTLGTEVSAEQWAVAPEMYRVGEHLHCLLVLPQTTFCLSFLIDGDSWYFRHIENVFIRLDRIDSLPASTFPDIAEEQKAWIREEIYWSQQVRFFNTAAAEKGRQAALDMYRDGLGYFLAAKTWVPFVEPRRAFVLYACWELANLRGNSVVLEHLDDTVATIRFKRLLFFELYEHSAHLREQIPLEDYTDLFMTIWRDRASSAGWDLQCEFDRDGDYVFNLTAIR